MRRTTILLICIAAYTISAANLRAAADQPIPLLIVAGQSNAVGFDAKPAELPADDADRQIMFWWRTGDPPPDEHDSVSESKWRRLQPQPLGDPKQPRQGRQYGNFAQPEGGFGPEFGLARTLYSREHQPLAVIKVAFSGTGMAQDWNHADPGEGGSCYRALITETRRAIAAARQQGKSLQPRALAWIQGESDANAQNASRYAAALGSMIAAIRRDLDAPDLIALTTFNTRFGGGKNPYVPTIVDQQKLVAACDPHCEYVDTSSATIANNVHFDANGTLAVGRLMADALVSAELQVQPAKRHFTIVTLGDSITKGVRAGVTAEQTFASLLESQLKKNGISARVVNVGIGGERTDQARKRLDRIVDLDPDLVTVMYGTNDSYVDQGKQASRITIDAYSTNLNTIVAELRRRGIRPILMTAPRWADDANANGLGENPNVRLEPYVKACRQAAQRWRLPLVDHFADWTTAREQGVRLRDWTTDGCHPNPAGHRQLADGITPVIQQTIGPELKTRRKLLSGEATRVVCFGDSVTGVYYHTGSRRAYTDMLAIALDRVSPGNSPELINAGISGNTTVNALGRIERDVLRHKPDLVTVMFGLNDMTRVPLDAYKANLTEIVNRCRAAGAEVILATPNNVIDTPGRPTRKLIDYCDAVRAVSREMNTPLCDCYQELEAVREQDGDDWRLLMSDPIHPNMDGHKRIAAALAQTVTDLRISLADVLPLPGPIDRTLKLLRGGEPVRVLAMPPFDELFRQAVAGSLPDAKLEVETWAVGEKSLAQIEHSANQRVRKMKPDLVLIAVPRAAAADSREQFVNSFGWIMNWSLQFQNPTWDCVVIHPSVTEPTPKPADRDALIRRLVRAQDLHLIDRAAGDDNPAANIFRDWFRNQAKP